MAQERENALRDAEVRRAQDIRKVSRQLRDVDQQRKALLEDRKQKLTAGTDHETLLMLDGAVSGFTKSRNQEALQKLSAGLGDAAAANEGVMAWNKGRSESLRDRLLEGNSEGSCTMKERTDQNPSVPKLRLGGLAFNTIIKPQGFDDDCAQVPEKEGKWDQPRVNQNKLGNDTAATSTPAVHKTTHHPSGSQSARRPRPAVETANTPEEKDKPKVWHVPKTARYGSGNRGEHLVGLDAVAAHVTATNSRLDSRASGARTAREGESMTGGGGVEADACLNEGDLEMEDVEDGVAMPACDRPDEDDETRLAICESGDEDERLPPRDSPAPDQASSSEPTPQAHCDLAVSAIVTETLREEGDGSDHLSPTLHKRSTRLNVGGDDDYSTSGFGDHEGKEQVTSATDSNEDGHDDNWQVLWDDTYQSWYYFHEPSGESRWCEVSDFGASGGGGEAVDSTEAIGESWLNTLQHGSDTNVAVDQHVDQVQCEAGCAHRWRVCYTAEGAAYFSCETSGVSQWNDPRGSDATQEYPVSFGWTESNG
jgi:hypothetical protein